MFPMRIALKQNASHLRRNQSLRSHQRFESIG